MFNLGLGEMIALATIALLVIGPKQLPEMARLLGRLVGEFRKMTADFTSTFTDFNNDTRGFFNETQSHFRDIPNLIENDNTVPHQAESEPEEVHLEYPDNPELAESTTDPHATTSENQQEETSENDRTRKS
ncbi:MAG: twin-arginine translocase TatA/TatE family subunit [Bdellovibrionales bacterium]|nr:twin-arginine translocase TatA/TatE family subunit [Bdellovibrionales bacterium]